MMTPPQTNLAWVAFRPGSLRALLVICLLLILGSVMSSGWHVAIKAEYGALELASFVCLSAAALVSGSFYREGSIRFWAVPAVFLLLALREMDFQNWWFEPGLLRTEIFTAPVALWQKAISAIAMGVVAVTLVSLLTKGTRPFLAGVLARECWALFLLISLLLVAAALVLDGVESNLAIFQISIASSTARIASYGEELVEFGFAFSLLTALVTYVRLVKRQNGVR